MTVTRGQKLSEFHIQLMGNQNNRLAFLSKVFIMFREVGNFRQVNTQSAHRRSKSTPRYRVLRFQLAIEHNRDICNFGSWICKAVSFREVPVSCDSSSHILQLLVTSLPRMIFSAAVKTSTTYKVLVEYPSPSFVALDGESVICSLTAMVPSWLQKT